MREFVDDCANHQPTGEDTALALELMDGMSGFFPDEGHRANFFRRTMQNHNLQVTTTTISTNRTDGAIEFKSHIVALFEVKAEIGSKGAEPFTQAILYYTCHGLGFTSESQFVNFNFPCLIVTVYGLIILSYPSFLYNAHAMYTGAQISFSGAVWRQRPHFQVLTPTIPLFCHMTDMNMRESVARHLGAFKKAVESLKRCHEALDDLALLKHLDPLYPDPHSYRSLQSKTTVNFEYTSHMDPNKLLFFGKTDNGESICIKFVRRYSKPAHEKCVSMGIAPELRGFEEIGAGWTMVIMDALNADYQRLDQCLAPAKGTHELIKARLVELHQAHFVHGDLRDVNIMVRGDGQLGFMLVDFDWSGVIGEVRYPMYLNKSKSLGRPDDVSDGTLIKPEHDMAMLEHILRSPDVHGSS